MKRKLQSAFYGAMAALMMLAAVPAQAGITNAVSALETEMTTGLGVITTAVQTVVLAALAVWGIFLVVRWFKRAVKS